ncbi:Acetyltransferase (GNAT) family protein [Lishizhenia tianjinensis]|uniref:Acetyltransferase (GNAT) family protein n=1 Tax=Lishizhenia tianjinensis TaxID=477690 RepID=A0A1I6YWF6_9FLAO|nr:GNAT family N-acetyltransferase [Lishizhenia tianjinensis]SFT54551.1 Acetyltransferase (GNAT) family protein [Lishizhenia tianjinensis]
MEVKSLKNTDIEVIIDCFLKAFSNHFVDFPDDPDYFKNRWTLNKVDFSLSYGMFYKNELVGFILNAIDTRNGKRIAYNAGTGVIPKQRGKKITKTLYEHALPILKKEGVEQCLLEVITLNEVAIHSYETIGFTKRKKYRCFSGEIKTCSEDDILLQEMKVKDITYEQLQNDQDYSWDYRWETIKESNDLYYTVSFEDKVESYFIFNPASKQIVQFEVLQSAESAWARLFQGIKQVSPTISINNVDENLEEKIEALKQTGLKNAINQYEMVLDF